MPHPGYFVASYVFLLCLAIPIDLLSSLLDYLLCIHASEGLVIEWPVAHEKLNTHRLYKRRLTCSFCIQWYVIHRGPRKVWTFFCGVLLLYYLKDGDVYRLVGLFLVLSAFWPFILGKIYTLVASPRRLFNKLVTYKRKNRVISRMESRVSMHGSLRYLASFWVSASHYL